MRRAVVLALVVASAAGQGGVKSWTDQLRAKDEDARIEAVVGLARMGPAAKSAVPALAQALADRSEAVCNQAFQAIKSIGPGSVPALVKALGDPDDEVRSGAAALLAGEFAKDISSHLPRLASALKDDSCAAREDAARALGRHGGAGIELLIRGLAAREERSREAAIVGLVVAGEAAVGPLAEALVSAPAAEAREAAARALGELKAERAGDALLAALSDPAPAVAGAAARALGETRALPHEAVSRLVAGLGGGGPLREGCIDGLAAYGDAAREALAAALRSADARPAAAHALARMGEPACSTIKDALGAEEVDVRRAALAAARALPAWHVSADVIEAVGARLRDPVPSVRADAARTLGSIGPRARDLPLRDAAGDPDPTVRAAALSALGQLGIDHEHAEDPDPAVRVEAVLARWRVRGGPGAEELGKVALDATAESRVRVAALSAIGRMGLAARDLDLTPLLMQQPVEVRRAAADALAKITLPSALAVRESRLSRKPSKAVDAALASLAAAQGKDGEWDLGTMTTGATGLALLAFLAAGCGPSDPPHGKTVEKGLAYLMRHQDDRGMIGTMKSHEFLLCHGIATLALAEAWAIAGDDRCRRAAQWALDYIAWARNPYLAWRYEPRGGENDTHITTWLLTALKMGEVAGLDVDPQAYTGAGRWIRIATGRSGRTGYNFPGSAPARPEHVYKSFPVEAVETMTAAGLWCRHLLGGDALSARIYGKGVGLVLAKPPLWSAGHEDHVYWHFAALALYQDGDASYRRWEKPLMATLDAARDPATGAFQLCDVWAGDGGQTYVTAMGVLTLLTPSRYPREFLTKPKVPAATRAAIAALRKAQSDEDPQVREIAAAACARLPA